MEFNIAQIIEYTGGSLITDKEDKELRIRNIRIDSRTVEENSLYIAIKGEKNDGHHFLKDVYEKGTRVCLISNPHIEILEGMQYILVEDTLRALQQMAKRYRQTLDIPMIAVTGSVGKTTTREMIAAALSAGLNTFKTPANHNSQIGVPLTMLSIEDEEIAVLEMGISEFGEMCRIADIVAPDVAVITNIGDAHIQNLLTKENIRDEKFHIQDRMPVGSKVLLNYDDTILKCSKVYEGLHAVYVSTEDREADVFAKNIQYQNGLASFVAHIYEYEIPVMLSVYGKHQISNALVALTVAYLYGIDLKKAAQNIHDFQGFLHRQQILQKEGMTIIDDTYNASPASMKAGIDILADISCKGRKIAILADMKELGENYKNLHQEVGYHLASYPNIDELIVYGEDAKYIKDGALRNNISLKTFEFAVSERDALLSYLKENVKKGDCVLFKGSHSMGLEYMIEKFLED